VHRHQKELPKIIAGINLDMVGEDRIVFGMDFPAYNPGPEISKVRDADITEAQKKKIMGENTARILGL
jgi:predicted TIM-barrel fold metal-dependent hydrolase